MKKTIRNAIWKNKYLFLAYLVLIGLVWLWLILDIVPPKQAYSETLAPKIDDMAIWLIKLRANENCANKVVSGEHIGTWDNGSYSFSHYCWKLPTFNYFIGKYRLLPYAERSEWINWLGDYQFETALARRIIETEPGGWRNWQTTVVYKIGLPPR